MTGAIARRIVPYVNEGESLGKGQRLGLIRFGSRVDLIMPPSSVRIIVKKGNKLRAGVTSIAEVAMAAWSRVSLGDLFTLANGVLGFIAITYILDEKFFAASGLILLSMMMDGLDGYIARRFCSKHSMGQVLDSISDSISFAFAPALLVYAEFHQSPGSSFEGVVSLACAVPILATGLLRLARFSAGGFQLSYFVGMPAPAAALFIVLTCLLFGATAGS